MKFSHYSAVPLTRVHSVAQKDAPDMKPQGLWLSVDGPDDWHEWCTKTKYRAIDWQRLRYRVSLHMSRILVLSTPQELNDFSARYTTVAPWEQTIPDFAPSFDLRMYMNWKAVAELYAGIIIAPYQWASLLDLMWYYGWDCASGCVWDAAAVLSVRRLKSVRPRRTKLPDGKHLQGHGNREQNDRDP